MKTSLRYLLPFSLYLLTCTLPVHAINVTGGSFPNGSITPNETLSPNGTTIQFTLDGAGSVNLSVVQLSATPSVVTSIDISGSAGSNNYFWNALWPIGSDLGRQNGNYQIILTPSGGGNSFTIPTPLQITSVDIHNVNVTNSVDANGNATAPYTISYALAKNSLVTVKITTLQSTLVRTLVANQVQSGEATAPLINLTWDGLDSSGHPAPANVYNLIIDAKDPSSSDLAIQRTRSISVGSVAGAGPSPQSVFESNAYVSPNPVRGGTAKFKALAVRDGASITLKIYTLTGTLVRQESLGNVANGTYVEFDWDTTNASGKKVGRGLYYCVFREDDSQGTLQTVYKMAVIQ